MSSNLEINCSTSLWNLVCEGFFFSLPLITLPPPSISQGVIRLGDYLQQTLYLCAISRFSNQQTLYVCVPPYKHRIASIALQSTDVIHRCRRSRTLSQAIVPLYSSIISIPTIHCKSIKPGRNYVILIFWLQIMTIPISYIPVLRNLIADAGNLRQDEIRDVCGFCGLDDNRPPPIDHEVPGSRREVNLVSKNNLS
jgi:hypothetical protein